MPEKNGTMEKVAGALVASYRRFDSLNQNIKLLISTVLGIVIFILVFHAGIFILSYAAENKNFSLAIKILIHFFLMLGAGFLGTKGILLKNPSALFRGIFVCIAGVGLGVMAYSLTQQYIVEGIAYFIGAGTFIAYKKYHKKVPGSA